MGAGLCHASLASCNTDGAWDVKKYMLAGGLVLTTPKKKLMSNARDDRLSVQYFSVEGQFEFRALLSVLR